MIFSLFFFTNERSGKICKSTFQVSVSVSHLVKNLLLQTAPKFYSYVYLVYVSCTFLQLTNYIVEKELSHCPKLKDLKCNEAKKKKIESYVRKHMSKFGEEGYKRED